MEYYMWCWHNAPLVYVWGGLKHYLFLLDVVDLTVIGVYDKLRCFHLVRSLLVNLLVSYCRIGNLLTDVIEGR